MNTPHMQPGALYRAPSGRLCRLLPLPGYYTQALRRVPRVLEFEYEAPQARATGKPARAETFTLRRENLHIMSLVPEPMAAASRRGVR